MRKDISGKQTIRKPEVISAALLSLEFSSWKY